jgi:hypothetical protein
VQPELVFIGYEDVPFPNSDIVHKAAITRYRCPHCGGMGPRRKPIERHMGMIPNVDDSCPVLLAVDQNRRKSRTERDDLPPDEYLL